MARTELEKMQSLDRTVLRSGSRLRLRALALLEGAMEASGVKRAELARRLGVRKSAVTSTLDGSGNLRLQTLAEYLGVLGYEVELVVVKAGEVALSMRERREPEVARLTLRDHDWGRADNVIPMRGRKTSRNRTAASHVSVSAQPTWGSTSVDMYGTNETQKVRI